jgi:hypothetical protein
MPIDSCVWQILAALPLAAGEPAMSADMAIRIVSRALHLLSAIILGGGLFYMRSVLSPSGAEACFAGSRQVWARWTIVASTFLLATGLYNYMAIISDSKVVGARALPSTYHMLFGVKFLLGIGVMFVAALVAGKTPAAERARGNIGRWLNLGWFGVMTIVILGAVLRMLH